MLRALDPSHLREQAAGSPARLLELQQRWLAEARAIATLLLDLEAELETLVRDLAFHKVVGEARPDLELRIAELAAECEELTTESAHVQLALAGIRLELDRLPPSPFHHRTPA
jgi:hypothetical protein